MLGSFWIAKIPIQQGGGNAVATGKGRPQREGNAVTSGKNDPSRVSPV